MKVKKKFNWEKFKNREIAIICKDENLFGNLVDNFYANDITKWYPNEDIKDYRLWTEAYLRYSCRGEVYPDYKDRIEKDGLEIIEWEYSEIKGKDILKVPSKYYRGIDNIKT